MSENGESEEVGYRRPPRSTQFKPGRSGNPKGRPKGSKNTLTILSMALDERVVVTENGKRRKVSKREVIAKQLVNKAAAGDLKAIPIILIHAQAHEQLQAAAAAQQEKLSQGDEISMAGIMARMQDITSLAAAAKPQSVSNTDDNEEQAGNEHAKP